MILQTTITILLLILIIGRIQFVQATLNISSTFSGENAFYFMPYQYINASFDLREMLNKSAFSSYKLGEIGNLCFSDESDNIVTAYGYNDIIIDSCHISLNSGLWFNELPSDFPAVPAIAIGDSYSIGDTLTLKTYADQTPYLVKIIGTISTNSHVISFDESASKGASSTECFITPPQYSLILPYDSSHFNSIQKTVNPNYRFLEQSLANIIIFEEGYKNNDISTFLSLYGHTTYIMDMLSNYNASLSEELLTYGIVCFVFTILTIVGIGGNNGIQNMLNEHEFVVYFMLGATQKRCVQIEAIRGSLLILFSLILSLLIYILFPAIYPVDSFFITPLTFLFVIIYLLCIYFITSGIFLFRLGRKNIIFAYKQRS